MLDAGSEAMARADEAGQTIMSLAPKDDAKALRHAFGRFATGVTVVTISTPDGPLAITANSFSSVSLEPPLVLWSISRKSRRFEAFRRADHQAIHVLGAEQADLCWRFSRSGSDFSGLALVQGRNGVPLLRNALARFECEIINRVDAGDHVLQIARVLGHTLGDGEPLVFGAGRYGRIEAMPS